MSRKNRRSNGPKAASVSTLVLGQPGLSQSGGFISEEMHPRLRGIEAARAYEEMSQNDATVGAALYSIEGFLRRIKWTVKPANESARAVKEAAFIESCRHDMDRSWSDIVCDALSMLTYGYALHEVVLKYRRGLDQSNPRYKSKFDDGRVGWRNIDLRAQNTISRWDIDPKTGEIYGAYQTPVNYGGAETYLPMDRCVHFRTKTLKNNPEGRSVLRSAFRSWHFKKRLEETEAIGLVRSLQNLPKIELPAQIMSPNASTEERKIRAQFERMASLLSKDQLTAIVMPASLGPDGMPTGYKFDTIGSVGNQATADPVIRRYDHRILATLASEFLLLGSQSGGSFALANQKNANFTQSLEWYADVIAEGFNTAINRLMEANAVPPQYWPSLQRDPISEVDVAALGLFLSQASNFLTPTLSTENKLRERSNLPLIAEDEFDPGSKQREADLAPPPVAPTDSGGAETTDDEDI